MLHADDAGLSVAINQAVLWLVQAERLESLSIIANSEHTAAFCWSLRELWPKVRKQPLIFLHFNLVECRSLAHWPDDAERIDKKGNFYFGYGGVVRSLLRHRIDPGVVRAELEAQYQRVCELGFTPVGIDSHQHMHALAPIAEVVRDFADEHSLTIIRSYDDMRAQTLVGAAKLLIFRMLAIATEVVYYRRPQLPTSWHGHIWREFVMTSWESVRYSKLKKGQIIACHPGSNVDRGFIP